MVDFYYYDYEEDINQYNFIYEDDEENNYGLDYDDTYYYSDDE